MTGWHYEYTPYLWPTLLTVGISAFLAAYGWRRRSVPAAVPFAVMMMFILPWELGAALEAAAVEGSAKVFWFMFQSVWPLPAVTAAFWFTLAYADLRRWMVRRTLIALAIPPIVGVALVLTNAMHHCVWVSLLSAGGIRPVRGVLGQMWIVYGSILAVASTLVLVWLFVRSPLNRVPVGICLAGQLACRLAYLFQETYGAPDPRLDLKIVGLALTSSTYALALFRFRMFNLIPIARDTLVEQMPEGVLVLDTERRIVDLNPAAERILSIPAARARGMDAFAALAVSGSAGSNSEITLGAGDAARTYGVHISPLTSRSKLPIGQLVLLRDITEPKRAHGQLVEQQRALATLRERDRVARELHDSLGQLFGYVKMQATAVRGLLQRGQHAQADVCLAQLASVAQDAHADVREYIVGARTGLSANDGFLAALETYRLRFGEASGIRVNLDVQPGLTAQSLDPMVEAQLLRIIQEALTNVRKHARAHSVEIHLGMREGRAEAIVQDDGAGFDPALLETAAGHKFGLRLMKERADEVGGGVRVSSTLGGGTQVTISVPLRKELS